ncbi:hypothetical protein [Thermaurantiacus sp.]
MLPEGRPSPALRTAERIAMGFLACAILILPTTAGSRDTIDPPRAIRAPETWLDRLAASEVDRDRHALRR